MNIKYHTLCRVAEAEEEIGTQNNIHCAGLKEAGYYIRGIE
jgi:hypothetical protein